MGSKMILRSPTFPPVLTSYTLLEIERQRFVAPHEERNCSLPRMTRSFSLGLYAVDDRASDENTA